jgi:hypothetical protein
LIWIKATVGGSGKAKKNKKGIPMSYRTVASIAAAAILGIACISTDAFARGGARVGGGVHRAGVYHGGAYRGAAVRRGVAVGVGAAAVGAAVAAPRYYNSTQCGYYGYPPC